MPENSKWLPASCEFPFNTRTCWHGHPPDPSMAGYGGLARAGVVAIGYRGVASVPGQTFCSFHLPDTGGIGGTGGAVGLALVVHRPPTRGFPELSGGNP